MNAIMINDNPFTLTFGREPISFINREQQTQEILQKFLPDNPECQVLMLTGVRGTGKTVSLTNISNELRKRKEWIVVDLNPERDMLQSLAAELSNLPSLGQIFLDASINLSFLGFGINIDGIPPITDISVALDKMLSALTKRNKKILVTIDEATSTLRMREFAAQFQIYLRRNYSIFLIMTGLYDNVNNLQNEKSLTFLYRAPKIEMEPLSIIMIAEKYKSELNLTEKNALEMANATKGYAYAFQLLGYLCFKNKCTFEKVLTEYDAYLEQYVYDKIYSELSFNDQEVLKAMALSDSQKVEDVREKCKMNSSEFSVYRERLIKKSLITAIKRGYIDYVLPRFKEFIIRKNVY